LNDFSPAVALASAPDRLVYDDANQPRGELGVAAKISDRAVREQPGFLHRILRLGIVLQDAARRAVEHLVMPVHQHLECILVAGRDALRQLRVG